MVGAVIQDQYSAARGYFVSSIGVLLLESLARLPAYLRLKYRHSLSQPNTVVHWKSTVVIHKLLVLPSPLPLLTGYHGADLLRFVSFAALNVIFGINENQYTTDYKLYGWLTIANGGLVLLLAARTNLFAIVLRIPSPVLLQYHRWFGFATVAHGTVHLAYNIMHTIRTDQVASSFVNTRIRLGVMAWLSLVVIGLTALPIVRRRMFEAFYYAHALFFVFMVGALIHTTHGPEFLLPGFSLWVVDRTIRFAYNFRGIEVDSVTHYDGDVTKFKIRGIRTTQPGQVVWLQIPGVSHLNWHPFTVASAPGESSGLHTIAVRALGGYTRKLQLAHDDYKGGQGSATSTATATSGERRITMRVDGPYGVGRLQWGSLPVAVLIAGGIGMTPGISIASHLIRGAPGSFVSYVHVLWIVKDSRHIGWFLEELRELHALSLGDSPASLDITIHTTGSSTAARGPTDEGEPWEMQELQPAACPWVVKGGRPDIAAWINHIKAVRAGSDAAINVCGPKSLINETRKAAMAASSESGIFYVEEEVFEL